MRTFLVAATALLLAGAAPQPSIFTRTDCTGRSPGRCTGPQGNVLAVQKQGSVQALTIDGQKVFSVVGWVAKQAEWHRIGPRLTGLVVPVSSGGRMSYAVVRLASPDVQSTCLVAAAPNGGLAAQLVSRAGDMQCLPEPATHIQGGRV